MTGCSGETTYQEVSFAVGEKLTASQGLCRLGQQSIVNSRQGQRRDTLDVMSHYKSTSLF